MNLLIVNYEYPPIGAGAASASFHTAKSLQEMGHSVTVVTSAFKNLKGYSNNHGIHIYRIKALRRNIEKSSVFQMLAFVFRSFFILPGIIKDKSFDFALIYFSIPCGPIGFFLKKKYKIPYVISLRGGDVPFHQKELNRFHFFVSPIRKKVLKNAFAITANSESFAALSMKVDPFPVTVIHNGVDTDFFKPDDSIDKNAKPFKILFVGRFQPEKNIIFLLENFSKLKKQSNSFILNIVGDGPLKKQIEDTIILYQLENCVFLHGWLDKNKILNLYQNSHCLINPSLGEGMPNVVLEAMACALPVIASNVRGNDAVVFHKETGFLFDLQQPDLMMDYINQLNEDYELRNLMGEKARQKAKESFSWYRTAEQYHNLMRK